MRLLTICVCVLFAALLGAKDKKQTKQFVVHVPDRMLMCVVPAGTPWRTWINNPLPWSPTSLVGFRADFEGPNDTDKNVMACLEELNKDKETQTFLAEWSKWSKYAHAKTCHVWEIRRSGELAMFLGCPVSH